MHNFSVTLTINRRLSNQGLLEASVCRGTAELRSSSLADQLSWFYLLSTSLGTTPATCRCAALAQSRTVESRNLYTTEDETLFLFHPRSLLLKGVVCRRVILLLLAALPVQPAPSEMGCQSFCPVGTRGTRVRCGPCLERWSYGNM